MEDLQAEEQFTEGIRDIITQVEKVKPAPGLATIPPRLRKVQLSPVKVIQGTDMVGSARNFSNSQGCLAERQKL